MHKILEAREKNLTNGLAEIAKAKEWLADFKGSLECEKESFHPIESDAILNGLETDIGIRLRLYKTARKESIGDADVMAWLKVLSKVVFACNDEIEKNPDAKNSALMIYRDEARQAFELVRRNSDMNVICMSIESLSDGSERVSLSSNGLFSKNA